MNVSIISIDIKCHFEISRRIRKHFGKTCRNLILDLDCTLSGRVLPQLLAAGPHPGRVEPAGAGPGHAALRRGAGQEGRRLGHSQGLRHDR